jgi:hypothetical protein
MKRPSWPLLALLGLGACSNGRAQLGLALGAQSGAIQTDPASVAAASVAAVDAQGSAIKVTSVALSVREIRLGLVDQKCHDFPPGSFQAPVDCDGEKVRVRGPFVFDLLSPASIATLASLDLPPMRFDSVLVKVNPARGDDRPECNGDGDRDRCSTVGGDDRGRASEAHDDRGSRGRGGDASVTDPNDDHNIVCARPRPHLDAGKSLQIKGSVTANGVKIPFLVNIPVDENIRFLLPAPVSISGGTVASMVLSLDVTQWFASLPITSCLQAGDLKVVDGTLVLQNTSGACAALEQALTAGVMSSPQSAQ